MNEKQSRRDFFKRREARSQTDILPPVLTPSVSPELTVNSQRVSCMIRPPYARMHARTHARTHTHHPSPTRTQRASNPTMWQQLWPTWCNYTTVVLELSVFLNAGLCANCLRWLCVYVTASNHKRLHWRVCGHWRKKRCIESEGALALTDWGGSRGFAARQQLEESLLYGFFALAGGRITCNHQP